MKNRTLRHAAAWMLLPALLLGTAACQRQHRFTITGEIAGLQPGDTLRFERIILPDWDLEPAFDLVVADSERFDYKGRQPHDQKYLITYHPKEGKAPMCDLSGKEVIVTDGDHITLSGTADYLYYCRLQGGVYDDPLLAEALRLEDSLGRYRGDCLRLQAEAMERGDTVTAQEHINRFNRFYDDHAEAMQRTREAMQRYRDARPEGTLYLLLSHLARVTYQPVEESKAAYAALAPALQESYYGQRFAEEIARAERLAEGQPGPDFSVVATDGTTRDKASYAGRYLLVYHWGLCPGSIYIDAQVRALHDRYRAQGFEVLGITESIATIRKLYEQLPADTKTPVSGTDDIRPVLGEMLHHTWTEAELETGHPENGSLCEAYDIEGWPFFVLLGPDGTIRARGFSDAFYKAREILDRELGEPVADAGAPAAE